MSEVEVKVYGTPVKGAITVPVDLPAVACQRKVYKQRARNYIKSVGEFDWNLFGVISVVEYPDGNREIVDGGHRVFLVKEYLPHISEVPAVVLPVEDEQQASRLFHRFNGTASKSVTAEEQFVAQVLGDEAEALNFEKVLRRCKVCVSSNGIKVGSDIGTGYNGAEQKSIMFIPKEVRISKFKELARFNEEHLTTACNLINSIFYNDKTMNMMLLQGIVGLLKFFEQRGEEFNYDKFESFLSDKAKSTPQSKMTYPELRKHNHYGISIAYGLYNDMSDWAKINNLSMPFPLKVIKQAWESAGSVE